MSDAVVTSIVTGVVTITTVIVGVVTLWLKLKYGADKTDAVAAKVDEKAATIVGKVDDNTKITKEGIKEAGTHAANAADAAKDAADAAVQAATGTAALAEQLNGKLETKIESIVKAHIDNVMVMFNAHMSQDDKNMQEIRQALGDLRDQIRKTDK